ncbi:MAG TPA: peroxiredoxin [Nitriliruptorales bacterium]|nr:peroxiredoxin [Nitriliruptorales bacterium]
MAIEVGAAAPPFTLPDADGRMVALDSFRGRPVVVYFYPKDETPGCTTQACDIRDRWSDFQEAGAAVIGISPDPPASHRRFRERYRLPHVLLSDEATDVLRVYGAWGPRRRYGRESEGVLRSTVLIGADGRVAAHWPTVRPRDHADQVLTAIRDLLAADGVQ